MTFTSTKTFANLPCAHRQWRHEGLCRLIHGYSRSFHFVFGAHTLDKCGFAVDFGELKWLKSYMEHMFDHTLLIAADDPEREMLEALQDRGGCALRIMHYGPGMEGSAQTVCEYADKELRTRTKGRCWVISVEARENDKNSAIYHNPDAGFKGWL